MPIPTRAALKALFETGDKPSQADFAELIDAIYDLNQQTSDNADSVSPAALVYATVAADVWTIQRSAGVATVTHISKTTTERIVRITFSAALLDVNYVVGGSGSKTIAATTATVNASPSGTVPAFVAATGSFAVNARTTGYVDIKLPVTTTEVSVIVYSP